MPQTLELGHHYESLIQSLVESGRYPSAREVVRDGLRLVEEREAKLAALRKDIAEGLNSGPSEVLDMDAIKAVARRGHRPDEPAARHGA